RRHTVCSTSTRACPCLAIFSRRLPPIRLGLSGIGSIWGRSARCGTVHSRAQGLPCCPCTSCAKISGRDDSGAWRHGTHCAVTGFDSFGAKATPPRHGFVNSRTNFGRSPCAEARSRSRWGARNSGAQAPDRLEIVPSQRVVVDLVRVKVSAEVVLEHREHAAGPDVAVFAGRAKLSPESADRGVLVLAQEAGDTHGPHARQE